MPINRVLLIGYERTCYLAQVISKIYFSLNIRGQRERSPLLTKIAHPSRPHLGRSQRSTQPECNGRASLWENRLEDHGNLLCQVSMLKFGLHLAYVSPKLSYTPGFLLKRLLIFSHFVLFLGILTLTTNVSVKYARYCLYVN